MKKIFLTMLGIMLLTTAAEACTNFLVGKKASADGSVFITYSCDSYGMNGFLYHFPAAVHPEGTMRDLYDWEEQRYLGSIPEARQTYNVIGNINEHQVAIAETTFGGREELVDTTGMMDYGSLMHIALQRSKTAREAISIITTLCNEYGYCSTGESFSIADPDEAWILEVIGKGSYEKGIVWVAMRIPDDCISAHANQSRIHKFNMKDKENVMYSKDVVSFARKRGYFSGKDEDFNFAAAYCPFDFGGLRYCDARVWSFFNMFGSEDMNKYLDWAKGDATATAIPLYMKPKKPLSLQDVMNGMRDHYEGTPFDISGEIAGGMFDMPYRLSPLSFEVDGVKYFNERPISTFQSAFVFVAQMRRSLPNPVGGVLWFGCDDADMMIYTPVYCCTDRVPDCYAEEYADPVTFSWKSSYWVFNWVANMVYPKYSLVIDDLRRVQRGFESRTIEEVKTIEAEAARYMKGSPVYAKRLLTDYTCRVAEDALAEWKKFAEYMIVKYNDFAIKPEKNGKFERTPSGVGANVKRPGYPKAFLKEYVKQTGDKYVIPAKK